jgi:hypothetical protein
MGAAKLPFRIPATNVKHTASGTFDMRNLVNQDSGVRIQESEDKNLILGN